MPNLRRRAAHLALGPTVLALALTACGSPRLDAEVPEPTIVTGSAVWQGLVPASQYRERLAGLTTDVTRLRTSTRSGWTGRQDDVTGHLSELGGGTYAAGDGAGTTPTEVITTFLDEYGEGLFGVADDDLRPQADTTPLGDLEVVRTDQVHQGIPVVDGRLLFSVDPDQGSLRAVRGRSFGDLDVAPTPGLTAAEAIRAAEGGLAVGRVTGRPVLRIVPEGAGVLTWRLTVQERSSSFAGEGTAHVYVDADNGVEVRRDPLSAAAGPGVAGAIAPTAKIPDGDAVEVTGTDPFGKPVRANALRTPQGIALIDTTMPWFNRGDGAGAITTYSMDGSDDDARLPGKLVTSAGSTIADGEAIYAHSLARQVLDLFDDVFDWQSWNGKGAPLTTVVNLGDNNLCNAFFAWGLGMMQHGNPCTGPNGAAILVAPDVTAHEITHGVTGSTAGLIYSGQSGALNEAFSDYFGNVIGNLLKGADDATIGEDTCVGVSKPQRLCDNVGEDGKLSLRAMLNGTTYADLLKVVGQDLRLSLLGADIGDNGGVHLNSAIWNNALWTIRTQLARIDGQSGNESGRAKAFDKLVFATLTTQLTPTSGMVEASDALLGVINQAGADPVIARVARETLAAMKFCADCLPTAKVAGQRLTRTNGSETNPAVAGDRVAWIADERYGRLMVADAAGGQARPLGQGSVNSVAAAGDAFIAVEETKAGLAVVRIAPDGRSTELFRYRDVDSAALGVAGDAAGGAWLSLKDRTMFFVDPAGKVTRQQIPDIGSDRFQAIGAGGGSVGFGGKDGGLYLWKPGTGPTGFSRIGALPGTVLTVAAHGDRVYGGDLSGNGALFRAGQREPVKTMKRADGHHGAVMTAKHLIWAQFTEPIDNKVAQVNQTQIPDVDLALHSFASGKDYSLVRNEGWQAYPSATDSRLAWVDASFGNAEVLTDVIPGDL